MQKLRIIFSIVYLLSINMNILKSQVIQNGGFDITNPSMSMYSSPNAACPVFDDGFVYNWYRTHGTPEWIPASHPSTLYPTAAIKLHNNNNMNLYPNYGEGIVGNYPFKKGVPYTIEISIYNAIGHCGGSTDNYHIKVFATNNLQEGPNEHLYFPPNQYMCVAPVPTLNPGGSSFQKESIVSSGPHNVGLAHIISVSYIPNNNFSQIWVYNDNSGCLTEVHINYVKVYSCLNGTVHYQTLIPDGLTAKSNIFVHEDASITKNHIHKTTSLVGTNIHFTSSVMPHPNPEIPRFIPLSTEIIVDNENYFLALAVTDCDNETSSEEGDHSGGEQKSTNSIKESNSQSTLTIHPNPTTGKLTITMPEQGDYDIKVVNILGATVYRGQMKGQQKTDIQLDANLPAGNYTVHINGRNVNHVQKIALTR